LKQAADIKDQIEALKQELNALLGAEAAPVAASFAAPVRKVGRPPKQGGMSAAGKARIAAAQKLRWANIKAAKAGESPVVTETPAKKRKMSTAGRASIIAAQKQRWAKINGGTKAEAAKPAKKKRTMSAAGRAAIAAAARARWAKARAAGKSSL